MERATCFLLTMQILVFDVTKGDELTIHRNSVNVTVGQSILLPTSYTIFLNSLSFVIEWTMGNKTILDYYADNSSINSHGIPTWSIGEMTIYPKYKGRVDFYPLNASLLLKNVKFEDTGTYTVMVSGARREIQLKVNEEAIYLDEKVERRWSLNMFALRTVLCFLPIISLIFITRY